jgi:probable F420-dependent oxidoreductase
MTTRPPALGLFAVNMHACADPSGSARIAALAEDLGYDSLWVADHPAPPSPRVPPSPLEPEDRLLDPVVALAHLAAHTRRIALGTGVIVLPQRNPVILAKQLAGVDVLSGGRLVFGAAAGYVEPELRAIGVPMAERGTRTDEYVQAMRSLWHDAEPAFHGRHVDFEGIDAHPRPVQERVPVVIGGHSGAALRRAARLGDGWFGWLLGPDDAAERIAALRAAEAEAGRDVPLRVMVAAPPRELNREAVLAYGELGVERVVATPPMRAPLDRLVRFVEEHAPERLGASVAD